MSEPLGPLEPPANLNPPPPITLPENHANPKSKVLLSRSKAPLPFPRSKQQFKPPPSANINLPLTVQSGNPVTTPLIIPTQAALCPSDRVSQQPPIHGSSDCPPLFPEDPTLVFFTPTSNPPTSYSSFSSFERRAQSLWIGRNFFFFLGPQDRMRAL
ncbi:hypothetical protein MRB53_001940 [Persea americana]|uniref:Uncharacterized protein n=1 Tax=Persea americana TaxID=3435 RepID=A0ACC2MVF2_PERAE|nr:hypothetical protein MRB53_001940 [Persea americana]